MAITRDDVLHVAALARLEIPEGEVDAVRDQLGAILEAVGKVSELDLTDVAPMTHPRPRQRVGRGRAAPVAPAEDALANGPDPVDGQFRVPAVGG